MRATSSFDSHSKAFQLSHEITLAFVVLLLERSFWGVRQSVKVKLKTLVAADVFCNLLLIF